MSLSHPLFSVSFHRPKPVIGMVHLLPLPGSPHYEHDMGQIVDRACADAEIYRGLGFDAIIVENYGDLPFFTRNVPAETVAAMTRIVTEIRSVFRGVIGINVLRNDASAALGIAVATDADFIRSNVHVGLMLSEQGILQGEAASVMRHRTLLNARIAVYADIRVKHAYPLVSLSAEEWVRDTVHRGCADGLIVSGSATGQAVEMDFIRQVYRCAHPENVPVFIGSGLSAENIASYIRHADGFIVGSALKEQGVTTNPVDAVRAEALMHVLEKQREEKPWR